MAIIIEAMGWLGAVGLLTAYMLLAAEKIKANSLPYQLLNFAAAVLLICNAWYKETYPFVLINTFWAAIAIYSILKARGIKEGK